MAQKSSGQVAAEGVVEALRRDGGPFVVAAEETRMPMVFMNAKAADPADQPLSVHIWYPTEARGHTQALGPYTHEAAVGAPIAGTRLPLVVISHGTGGSGSNQVDTAQTLVRAGFVPHAIRVFRHKFGLNTFAVCRNN